jgi:hypothetical protein
MSTGSRLGRGVSLTAVRTLPWLLVRLRGSRASASSEVLSRRACFDIDIQCFETGSPIGCFGVVVALLPMWR